MPEDHSEEERERKKRVNKLKARTSKMRLAASTFKPSTKRVPMDKEQKNQRRRLRDSIRKTEASNEAVRIEFNRVTGMNSKPAESVLPPKRNYTKRRNKPTNESIP